MDGLPRETCKDAFKEIQNEPKGVENNNKTMAKAHKYTQNAQT